MDNTYELLQTLNNNAKEMLAADFYKNLKVFEHVIKERSIALTCELKQFTKSLPDHVLDIIDSQDSVVTMFANSQEYENNKVFTIDALDEEDMSVHIFFNNTGKIIKIIFFNDRIQLTVSSCQNIVVYERKGVCLKLVDLFKDYYSLNKGESRNGVFDAIATFQKEKVERDIKNLKMLFG